MSSLLVIGMCVTSWTGNEIEESLLPFDMCRWQVEDRGVEVVHEVQVRHHLFFTSKPLLRLLGSQLLPLHRLVQPVVREVRVTSRGLSHIILRRLQGEGIRWWKTIGSGILGRY